MAVANAIRPREVVNDTSIEPFTAGGWRASSAAHESPDIAERIGRLLLEAQLVRRLSSHVGRNERDDTLSD